MKDDEIGIANSINQETFDQDSFYDKAIRMGFIRKVYAIFTLQLALTVGIISVFVYVDVVKNYVQENTWIILASFAVSFSMVLILSSCADCRRRVPTNVIFLMIFTVFEGVFLGSVSSFYEGEEIMIAVGVTGIVCTGVTIYAFQTKLDFTGLAPILFVLLLLLITFGIFSSFMYSRILSLVYSCVGALIFSMYLVFDTMLMLGGIHKYALSPEEYIFAALNLYLDVVNIFVHILHALGHLRDD